MRSKKHNVFTEDIKKIALTANSNKKIQSINSIETYDIHIEWAKAYYVKIKKLNVTI